MTKHECESLLSPQTNYGIMNREGRNISEGKQRWEAIIIYTMPLQAIPRSGNEP